MKKMLAMLMVVAMFSAGFLTSPTQNVRNQPDDVLIAHDVGPGPMSISYVAVNDGPDPSVVNNNA